MSNLVSVGSRIMMDIELLLNGVRHVIRGISHPTTDGMAVTRDVPAEAFRNWITDNADNPMVSGSSIFELPEDYDAKPVAKVHGFQPALDAHLADSEQVELAEKGAPDEELPLSAGSAGLAVPLPEEMPKPPTTVRVVKQVPNATTHEEIEERPVDGVTAPAADSPTQDISLSTDGGDSSNQTANAQNTGPTEDQTVKNEG